MWFDEPAPTHTISCESSSRSSRTRVTSSAPGTVRPHPARSPVAATTSSGHAIARVAAPRRRPRSSRVGAPVARHEREHRAPVADEDERLDDLRRLAADRVRGRGGGRRARRRTPRAATSTPRSRSTAATRSTGSGHSLHGASVTRQAGGRALSRTGDEQKGRPDGRQGQTGAHRIALSRRQRAHRGER